MGNTWRVAILSICFCSFAIQALNSAPHAQTSDAAANDPEWTELNFSMEKMHMSMAGIKPSGQSDTDFVRLMLPHHQAAIDMAKTQLIHGSDPQMRRLAQEIIADQQSEIELMQLWLDQHEPKTSEAHASSSQEK
jgi:uncharacterized protein (DUF305 family)